MKFDTEVEQVYNLFHQKYGDLPNALLCSQQAIKDFEVVRSRYPDFHYENAMIGTPDARIYHGMRLIEASVPYLIAAMILE